MAFVGRPQLALGLAAGGLLWAMILNFFYARRLGVEARSQRRIDGDEAIARQTGLSYGTPILVSAAVCYFGSPIHLHLGHFHASDVQGLLGVFSAVIVVWIASSHVDWYFIRPRIDGVVVEPPCRTSRDSSWKGITRKWYIHRSAASVVTMGGVVAVATIVTVVLAREWPNALSSIGGFAAIVSVGLWLMHDEIRSAGPTSRAIRNPPYWLGDDLKYETDMWRHRGFVLHVSVPVTKLVPLDFNSGVRIPDEDFREEPATLLFQARCHSSRFIGCKSADACRGLNPECTFRQPTAEIGRRRLVIL